MNQKIICRVTPFIKILRHYHKHRIIGLEHVPSRGRALLVVNHSLATYDISLLSEGIYEATGRMARPLADRLFFKLPALGHLVHALGGQEGSPENARQLLENEELVVVAPGGMQEAIRPSTERYQLMWEARKGFAKLSLLTGTPILLAMCPRADDIYKVYPTALTDWAYEALRVPLVVARGVGLSVLPKPIPLTHLIHTPIYPPEPKLDPKALQRQLSNYHRRLMRAAEALMQQALECASD